MLTNGQIMSWYHSNILRIPHGNQNPTKRYLTDEQIIELFTGSIIIEEKIDGKLSIRNLKNSISSNNVWEIYEDMTDKNTCHYHVMKYDKSKIPPNQKIILNRIFESLDELEFEIPFILNNYNFTELSYAKLNLDNPSLKNIYSILESLSKLQSHFGFSEIEGLVIKNYNKQLMGKWINNKFEDKLK